jgi:hypothetical protein
VVGACGFTDDRGAGSSAAYAMIAALLGTLGHAASGAGVRESSHAPQLPGVRW